MSCDHLKHCGQCQDKIGAKEDAEIARLEKLRYEAEGRASRYEIRYTEKASQVTALKDVLENAEEMLSRFTLMPEEEWVIESIQKALKSDSTTYKQPEPNKE